MRRIVAYSILATSFLSAVYAAPAPGPTPEPKSDDSPTTPDVVALLKRPEHAPNLQQIAASDRQWTGVAVSKTGRLFVNYPRWSMPMYFAVAELKDGHPVAYPTAEINVWNAGDPPAEHFVCVQSVHVDAKDRLWVVDAASPQMTGVVPGGAKLVQIDLATNKVTHTFPFDAKIAPEKSYLNDVRVDTATETAYLTDSGQGALIVLDLASGKARRLLDNDPSTSDEPETHIKIDEETPKGPDGNELRAQSDGIALSPDARYLYYQALAGRTLYRIETAALRDASLDEKALSLKVEKVGKPGVADGIGFDKDGWLYLSTIEEYSVRRMSPKDGTIEEVAKDDRLAWPDSFAIGSDGSVYVTTSQIHLMPAVKEPFRVFKVMLAGS